MSRLITRLFVAAFAAAVFGCAGGSADLPTVPSTPVTPLPQAVSLTVFGQTVLTAGTTVRMDSVVEKFSDNTTKNVTPSRWSTSAEFFAVVDSTGVVHALRLGVSRITASFQGMTGAISVTVVGTPWSQLPPISPAGKAWIKAYMLAQDGHFVGLADTVQSFYVGAGFDAQKAKSTTAKWSGGRRTFVQIADSASANVFFTTDLAGLSPAFCGWGGALESVNNVLTKVMVRVRADCTGDEVVLAATMGHAIGFMGNTTEPGVLSSVAPTLDFGPLLSEVKKWSEDNGKPGMIPVDP